jgi:hypothetical protein
MNCPLCKTEALATAGEHAMQACAACASTLGIIPMPPRTRPMRRCDKCNGGKFVRAIPREHSYSGAPGAEGPVSRPMLLTNQPIVKSKFRWTNIVGQDETKPIDIDRGYGVLEVYACLGCGAVEWYCMGVESIPIHPHLMTELVDLDGETPYR